MRADQTGTIHPSPERAGHRAAPRVWVRLRAALAHNWGTAGGMRKRRRMIRPQRRTHRWREGSAGRAWPTVAFLSVRGPGPDDRSIHDDARSHTVAIQAG